MTPAPLVTMMPFAADMNLGRAYNEAMELLPENGWLCCLDHDAIWTTRAWWHQLAEAIAFLPEAGAFVAMSNRIAPPWQQIGDREEFDMRKHREFGRERLKVRTLLDITDTMGFGGVAFALSKTAWRKAGGFVDGMLCVDHHMHFALRDAGLRVWLLEGLYVYHWRRACGDALPITTPRAAKCPCRGKEKTPSVRVTLPVPEKTAVA